MNETKSKKQDLPNVKDETKTSNIIEYTDKIQKNVSEDQIIKSTITSTQYYEMNNNWYDIVAIEFRCNHQKMIGYYSITSDRNSIDDDLNTLYKYLDKDPSKTTQSNLVGEKVPMLVYDNNKEVFVPSNFSKNSIFNKLIYTKYLKPIDGKLRYDLSYKHLYIIGMLTLIVGIGLSSLIILFVSVVYTVIILILNGKELNGEFI